ncbi:ImmA/IrrE family metallo-endopeptidase [Cohnella thailandensis]|uniref:ImmA/IrrE family metallo-endopeptidase n=1 Tax=Cohnella thailandensis TaxID=557557 RepID=A0A841T681_9BACL|nr:ImmA/IrrE family metallo-endopeptidase [Cohnella thailandensis]MBB6637377.1 ImmA/IrrE family metallo-endopeptidase [Cohnella thailandensis]MBP1976706.1 Zn-dependent peptidase ImmA (M78 family) [Cohnella thailandensis]
MLRYYKPTPMEQWIENLWRRAGISSPAQLNVDEVASRLNVWIHYMNQSSKALEWMGLRSILLDRRLSRVEQWEDFLHELCHVLRHAGSQTMMPQSFLEHQEADANRFVLYASVPYFMLRDVRLPDRQSEAADWIASHFGVTHTLAYQRLEQIQRRTFEAILWEEIEKLEESQRGSPSRSRSGSAAAASKLVEVFAL